MKFLRYIDKKLTSSKQKEQIIVYLFVGGPIGYIIGDIMKIVVLGWGKYHFSILNFIFTFLVELIITSPLIINYFLHVKKYKQLINKVKSKKEFNVKSLFDFDDFKKDQYYKCYFTEILNKKGRTIPAYYVCKNSQINNSGFFYSTRIYEVDLKETINKFELDDIKEDRLKKLKKLNKQPWYKINK